MSNTNGLTEELEQVLEEAAFRVTMANQRDHLRVKVQKDLIHAVNGGLFRVTPELINFVSYWLGENNESVVLLDQNQNPIMITDLPDFLDDISAKYQSAMNEYYLAYERIKTARNARKVIEQA